MAEEKKYHAEIERMLQLNDENTVLTEQIKAAEDAQEIQDLIDENTIAITQISVEMNFTLSEALRLQKPKSHKKLAEDQTHNLAAFFDTILHNAISGAFKFAIAAAERDDPCAFYEVGELKLPEELREPREALAWIEEEDDTLYKPRQGLDKGGNHVYYGPFTFNYVCFSLGADHRGMRLAIASMREMPLSEIESAYTRYKNKSIRQALEAQAAENMDLVNLIGPTDSDINLIEEEELM